MSDNSDANRTWDFRSVTFIHLGENHYDKKAQNTIEVP